MISRAEIEIQWSLKALKKPQGEFVHKDYKMHYVLSSEPYPEPLLNKPALISLQLLLLVKFVPSSFKFLDNDFAKISEVVQTFFKSIIDSSALYRKSAP